MRIATLGAGPAGLYAAILLKKAAPARSISVWERNRPDDTFGFGVVFSDATLGGFAVADAESYDAIRARFARWDDIDIHYGGEIVTSHGHGFAGMGRRALLDVLQRRARDLGVELHFGAELDAAALDRLAAEHDVVLAADGVNSLARRHWAADFGPRLDVRPNRFVWLGTTFPFRAFTFYFKRDRAGLFRVHAYRYAPDQSTFIVECTDETFKNTGLHETDEDGTVAYCARLFAEELAGHPLLKNRSHWRQFPTVRCDRWRRGNVALLGDAVHTAHFSIGSGTKLAMEGAIAVADALNREREVPAALAAYEAAHRKTAERLQAAAQVSLRWFEETERYHGRLPSLQFAFNLLTRSLRITHESLRERDHELLEAVDRGFAQSAAQQSGVPASASADEDVPAPSRTPFKLRQLVLRARNVVSVPPSRAAIAAAARPDVGLILVEARAEDVTAWRDLATATTATPIGLSLAGADLASAVAVAAAGGFALVEVRSDAADAVAAARVAWPAERPLAVRPSGGDLAALAQKADLVTFAGGSDERAARAAQVEASERARLELGVPSLLELSPFADADTVLAAGRADLCLAPAQKS